MRGVAAAASRVPTARSSRLSPAADEMIGGSHFPHVPGEGAPLLVLVINSGSSSIKYQVREVSLSLIHI